MSVLYIFKEGISGFRRAKLAAVGSIITITISLLLLGIFYVISTNTTRIVADLRARVEVEAFLDEPISRKRISEIETELSSVEGIARVQFVSKEEAAKIFKEEFGEDIDNVLDFNPLPPSFKIFLSEEYRTTELADTIRRQIEAIRGIATVAYRKDLLEFLDTRAKMLYTIGLAFGIFLGITAIFLVSNTIRLTIYAKRKAIQTMKLVGATRLFVRAPFVIEGIMQGIAGGIIAVAIMYYLITFAAGLVSAELAEFIHVDASFYTGVLTTGAFLGFFGSMISVRKFIGESVAN
ncbi:MAG: ABC transporter permease [Ignavibacteriae bacterium]|nr:ABC transporter permease [Ignavibacteriota bacterium]